MCPNELVGLKGSNRYELDSMQIDGNGSKGDDFPDAMLFLTAGLLAGIGGSCGVRCVIRLDGTRTA